MTLADELSRNGKRSGLTFAPEGGSERMRQVINKMVTEDDLIRTVTTAYSSGWRQVKLYFMCGLPTETDEDVLAIADLARRVIAAGREATGRRDIRCTVSIGGFVPKPHTPFQWAGAVPARGGRRPAARARGGAARPTGRTASRSATGTTTASPSLIEGLLSRGDRRVGPGDPGRVAGRRAVRRVGRVLLVHALDGAAARALAGEPVDLDWYTTRERDYGEVLPWDHLDSGLDRDWLWEDWQSAVAPDGAGEVEDCRWTPCYECGVCPAMGTEIQTGPTGERLGGGGRLLPVLGTNAASRAGQWEMTMSKPVPRGAAPPPAVQHLLIRYAKRGKMRFASHLDVARAFERGVRRAGLPIAYSAGFTPHPKISYAGGAPTGVASEAEYLSLALTSRNEAGVVRERLNAALPDGIDVIAVTEDAGGCRRAG